MSEENNDSKVKRVVLKDGKLEVTGTRNYEYELVTALNHETAQKIMEASGISETHPDYKKYYAQAMAAAHHCRRFNGDEESMVKSFSEELKKPDMTPATFRNFERNYRNQAVEAQQRNASGSAFNNDENQSAQHINENIRNTVLQGVDLRRQIDPTFPDIMYDERGLLTDVVLDLSEAEKSDSALGIINSTIAKYQDKNISFDSAENQFQVKGKPVSVQKFFSSKKIKWISFYPMWKKTVELMLRIKNFMLS